MNKKVLKILISVLCLVSTNAFAVQKPIRYVALGDSYTIGTGAQPDESWPARVTARLQGRGIPIELVGNLGHNGWTSRDLIDGELPLLQVLKPDYVTLLIGVNDWVQGVDARLFQQHVEYILGELLKIIPDPGRILIITIPDFSVTPTGRQFSYGRDIAQGILAFNQILLQVALRHHIKTIDLFPLSQNMEQDPSLIASDGLHPSAKGYAQWADLIEPVFQQMLLN